MSFSKRLREARRKKGYTQTQVAEKLNITVQSYSQYENGKRNPKKETLAKIANALNLGYSYTKEGEPYFFDFVDTVHRPEYEDNEKFNIAQFKDAENIERIVLPFNKLNDDGQDKAIEQVELLAEIPKYQKKEE